MCRKPALAATAPTAIVMALLVLAGPAFAWGGKSKKQDDAKPAAAAAAPAVTGGTQLAPQAKPAAPFKPTPADRAAADRLDPLGRAAFWAKVLDSDPRDTEAGLKLSKSLRALGQDAEAVPVAEQVLVVQPGNYEALLELARAQIGAQNAFYALQPLELAHKLNPKDWRPLSLSAIAYEATQQPDRAVEAFDQALKLAPDAPALLTNHAVFLAGRGKTVEAEAEARKAAALPGAGPQERQNLALMLGLSGHIDEAEKLIRRDLPPDQAEANLAYLRSMAGPNRSWGDVQKAQR